MSNHTNPIQRDIAHLRAARHCTPNDLRLIRRCEHMLAQAGLLDRDLGGGVSHLQKVVTKFGELRPRETHRDVMPLLTAMPSEHLAALGRAVGDLFSLRKAHNKRERAGADPSEAHLTAADRIGELLSEAREANDLEWVDRWTGWLALVHHMDMACYGNRPVALNFHSTLHNHSRGDGPAELVELRKELPEQVVEIWRCIAADRGRHIKGGRPHILPNGMPRPQDIPAFTWPRAGGERVVSPTPVHDGTTGVRQIKPSTTRQVTKYYEGAGGKEPKMAIIASQEGAPHCECCGEHHHPGNLQLDHKLARCHYEVYEADKRDHPLYDAIMEFAAAIGMPTHIDDLCNQQVLCQMCHKVKDRHFVYLPELWSRVQRADDYCAGLPRTRQPLPWRPAVRTPSVNN